MSWSAGSRERTAIRYAVRARHRALEALTASVRTFLGPPARIDERTLQSALSRLEMLRWLPALYRGTHLRHPRVWTVRARHVTVSSARPLPVHLDGEPAAGTPVTVRVCAGALRLRA